MKVRVDEDFKQAQLTRLVDELESANDIMSIRFEFKFDKDALLKSYKKIPIEYEANLSSMIQKVEANIPSNFDDLEQFEAIEVLEFEVFDHKAKPVPAMSQFDPAFREKQSRPGCGYESVLRERSGEPDLEKVQVKAKELQRLQECDSKEIVSAAIVPMPNSFLKPLDYLSEKVIRADCHPTLRKYASMPDNTTTEVDPAFALYPLRRDIVPVFDEIEVKRQSMAPIVQYMMGLSKTASGAYINNFDVPTSSLPGNFGVRVVDSMMPTNLSDVFRERRNTHVLESTCDNKVCRVPDLMQQPDEVDYLTDDEAGADDQDFEVPVPDLDELIRRFEDVDEKIHQDELSLKNYCTSLRSLNFEVEPRAEIILKRIVMQERLDSNISTRRLQMQAALPGMLQDLNEGVSNLGNKIYLR